MKKIEVDAETVDQPTGADGARTLAMEAKARLKAALDAGWEVNISDASCTIVDQSDGHVFGNICMWTTCDASAAADDSCETGWGAIVSFLRNADSDIPMLADALLRQLVLGDQLIAERNALREAGNDLLLTVGAFLRHSDDVGDWSWTQRLTKAIDEMTAALCQARDGQPK